MTTLTASEQLILEMINRARLDPAAEAARLGIDLNQWNTTGTTITATSKQVLAGNNALAGIAESHSAVLSNNAALTNGDPHNGAGDGTTLSRFQSINYPSGTWKIGENIGWNPGTTDLETLSKTIQDALFKDDPAWNRGSPVQHRLNILDDNFREVGIGVITGTVGGVPATIVTEDFGLHGTQWFLTGAVYKDLNGDNFYNIGEAVQGVSAAVTTTAGAAVGSDTTGSGGGWSVGMPGGTYNITFSGGGLAAAVTATVEAGNRNAKVDLVNSDEIFASATTTLGVNAKELHLLGLDNLNGTGNALDNVMVGNKGNNVLDGGNGFDTAVYSGNKASYFITVNANGTITVAGAEGTDTLVSIEKVQFADQTLIMNPAGAISISDMTITEGDNGTKVATFTVARANGTAAFDVNFATSDGTATAADGDYVATSGILHFGANDVSHIVSVTINGDTKVEANETFSVLLSGATNGATISDHQGVGTITNDDANINHAPVATASDHSLNANEWHQISDWVSVTDADGDAITQYQFWDSGSDAASGYFWTPDNAHNPVNTAITVNAADLGNVWVRGGQAAGSETMWVRAFDGHDWGAWDAFNLTTVANHAPVATASDHSLNANEWHQISDWVSVTDADGDAITQYQLWDGGTGAASGYFWTPDNPHHDAGTAITIDAANLSTVWVRGGQAAGSETMWVRAFDGHDWGAWDAFNLTTVANHAPVATASDHSLNANEWHQISDWVSVTDADGDAITQYQFWDSGSDAASGYFWTPDNAHNPVNTAITVNAADLGNVWVRGGQAAGSETMWVRAFDGHDWGAWDAFNLTTVANHAPVATASDQVVHANEWHQVRDWFSTTDADGDAITQYRFWDGVADPKSGYFWTQDNAHNPAQTAITVDAADLANVWYRGGQGAGNETIWVQAFDGHDWSEWAAMNVTTS